jgi:hypothetical protein
MMKTKQVKQAGPLESKSLKSKGKRGRPAFDDAEALRFNAFCDAIAMVFGRDPKEDESNNAAALSSIYAAIAVGEYIGNSLDAARDRLRHKLRNRDTKALVFVSEPRGARSIVRACRLPFMRAALARRLGCGQDASDDALAKAVVQWAKSELN